MIDRTPAARASAWEWLQTALLAANLAWTTLCLGGYLPETRVVTYGLTAVLVAVHFLGRATCVDASADGTLAARGPACTRLHPAGWLVLPFLVYAAANVLWVTPVRWLGWLDWAGWAQMIAVFWVVLNGIRSSAPQRTLLWVLVALGITGVVLAAYQRFVRPEWLPLGRTQAAQYFGRGSGMFGIPNSFAGLLLLVLPAVGALALRRRAPPTARVWWGWVAAVLSVGLLLTISRGAWLALAGALAAWPLSRGRWAWSRRVVVAGAILLLAGLLGGIAYGTSPKVRQRFEALVEHVGERSRPLMWRGAWLLFQEHPVFGSGAGSYNVLFERHRPELFPDDPQWAHNEYLNTLSDYGAVGFALFFGGCAVIAVGCWRRRHAEHSLRGGDWLDDAAVRGGLAVGLGAFAGQLIVEFHFKLPALALACATVAGLLVRRSWTLDTGPTTSKPRGIRAVELAVAVAVLVAAVWARPFFHGEGLRYRARDAIDRLALRIPEPDPAAYRDCLQQALPWLRRAVELAPTNSQAWADLAYATALWAHVEPARAAELGRDAERAADRALAGSSVPHEFWLRRGVARDLQGRRLEASADFTHALKLAPTNAYAWYYYAHHLSHRPTERGLMEAALAFCLRLDPGNRSGIALRQRLAISPAAP